MADETLDGTPVIEPDSTPPAPVETLDMPQVCPICQRFLRDGFCGHCGFEER